MDLRPRVPDNVAPTERDGHSLSGQVHVSSAICFAEGMTAYLYAHKVRIFATTRFFAKPYTFSVGNGWVVLHCFLLRYSRLQFLSWVQVT